MSVKDFRFSSSYCCNNDWPCQLKGNDIVCENGTILSWNEKCGSECLTSYAEATMTIATKGACEQDSNKCYINKNRGHEVIEVCDYGQNNESELVEHFCQNGKPCSNNVTKGNHWIGQCYDDRYLG